MSSFMSSIKFSTGEYTDIGGCRENQDAMLRYEDDKIIIISVIDGHGVNGKKIAEFCKTELQNNITSKMNEILLEPTKFLDEIFPNIHHLLALKIIKEKSEYGIVCRLEPSGNLLIKKNYADIWEPMATGGATMTIAIMIKETLKLYVANVGDSEAILCSTKSILRENDLVGIEFKDLSETKESDYIVITGVHSPNDLKEYQRISLDTTITKKPEFIYDSMQKGINSHIEHIYSEPITTPKYGYIKNVKKEYATYLKIPDDELPTNHRLAMTRSIGDFAMVPYGCSCIPTIRMMDCQSILQRYDETDASPMLCLLLSSDGVWDNWLYQDVQLFMMHSTCLNAVATNPNGTQQITEAFMERNKLFGMRNFNNASDNATSVVMYIRK